ncbi:MAG: methyltransferase domain-containing protein [Elusimicrobia bacterium]|nr:methyltransferase domain-containing protein [Elusimicrobiota bacterium]
MSILTGELVRLRVFLRPFAVAKYLKSARDPKLHLGCGSKVVPGWLNADKFKSNADIYLNLNARLPFRDNAFTAVYSEHTLEHIPTDHVPHLLAECRRVLKPGGILRLTVPDLGIYAAKYVAGERAFFEPIIRKYAENMKKNRKKYWLVRTPGGVFMSRVVQRFYHHRWMYDFETLSGCLAEIGFSKVLKQSCGKSLRPDVGAMDGEHRSFETLYVEAVK